MSQTPNTQSAEALDLVFWDTSAYRWGGPGDWNQWRYIPDGLGGEIGIRFGVSSGFGTFNWSDAPFGSTNDGTGTASFGKNEQVGLASTSVNAVRMRTPEVVAQGQINFTVELDFSRYKGSKVGGKDGVAGANTFIGVSDIFAGLALGCKTTVTITGTLADGSAASPAGWKLVNGGVAPNTTHANQPSAQLSLANGVLQGTSTPAPGGEANSIDTVMGLLRLDAAGYKTLHLRHDIYRMSGGSMWTSTTDNSGLYVASAFSRKPAQPPAPAKPPLVDLVVVIDTSVSMKDEADALSQTIAAAIDAAKTKCPSDLRVTYLGIEGTFNTTRFDNTVRQYLTQTANVDASSLKGRTSQDGASLTAEQKKVFDPREDGGRAIEDIATHFDWRPGASRSVFFLGDEALEGGVSVKGQDQEDIEAANRAIEAAKKAGTRVHTYLGTSKFSSDAKKHERIVKEIQAEFARVAQETGGKSFTSTDAQSGFQTVLEEVICGSRPSTTTTP
ncbi:VWA domain-containing protein [Sorangium sp. So ce1128]